MIDWINLIAGIIFGSAASSLVFWMKYGTRLDNLAEKFKSFSKYGANIPPTYCQKCQSPTTFTLVFQMKSDGKILNTYKCAHCGQNTMQYN